jgi:hypothetical protein
MSRSFSSICSLSVSTWIEASLLSYSSRSLMSRSSFRSVECALSSCRRGGQAMCRQRPDALQDLAYPRQQAHPRCGRLLLADQAQLLAQLAKGLLLCDERGFLRVERGRARDPVSRESGETGTERSGDRTFSASWSLSSFSRRKKSSRSSLSSTPPGVIGRLEPSLRPSMSALTDVGPRLELVGVAGIAGAAGALPLPEDEAHSDRSTCWPLRHLPTSCSSRETNSLVRLSSTLSSGNESSLLTRAWFLIDLARMPKRRVESVSASLYEAGEQLMMSVVRELPPSDSCRMRVNFESR